MKISEFLKEPYVYSDVWWEDELAFLQMIIDSDIHEYDKSICIKRFYQDDGEYLLEVLGGYQ